MNKEPAVIIGAVTAVIIICVGVGVALGGLSAGAAAALSTAVGSIGTIVSSLFIRSKVTPV